MEGGIGDDGGGGEGWGGDKGEIVREGGEGGRGRG